MVLSVQKLGLIQLSSISENHHHHHHHRRRRHSPEANSASLQSLFHNLFSKLENHHHQPGEAVSASLQAFRSDVSNYFNQLPSGPKPGSELLSLIFIQKILEILPMINNAFVKLLVEIEYPMSKWQTSSIDEYLNYTLNLLELLNSISSSLSRLRQARLSLSHALSLINESPSLAVKKFLEFQSKNPNVDYKASRIEPSKESHFVYSDEERVIHLAMADMKKIGSWICCLVLSSLSSDAKLYMEMRKSGNEILDSSFIAPDLCVLKEVGEINEAVNCLVLAMANKGGDGEAKELTRRLEVFEKGLMGLEKEGDCLFSEILATRNELLERFKKKQLALD